MSPVLVELRPASSEGREKKRRHKKIADRRIAIKPKSADKYVGRLTTPVEQLNLAQRPALAFKARPLRCRLHLSIQQLQ